MSNDNILVISDTHLPFELWEYINFVKLTQEKYGCGLVVHIGDLVDNHAISYHEHDPNGLSPADEMDLVDGKLKVWFKEFPVLYLCRGNHDSLVDRKAKTNGLPDRAFRQFREIWNLPKTWKDDFEFEFHGVKFTHGTGHSGLYPHMNAAYANRQSTVIGHLHSVAGIEWIANSRDCIFGMSVGCGIDRKSYAFNYGKDFKRKPIIACGVILDKGRYPIVVPMDLGRK